MQPDSMVDYLRFAGSIFDLKPDGQTFLQPVTLEMVVSIVAAAKGEDSVGVFLFDRSENRWTLESSSVYDAATAT
eukprot:3087436-Rhodomonas_salina.1